MGVDPLLGPVVETGVEIVPVRGDLTAVARPGLVLLLEDHVPVCRPLVLGTESITIGRTPGIEMPIADDRVSALHATLSCVDGRFVLAPLTTKTTTRVDDVAITAPTDLTGARTIRVGRSILWLCPDVDAVVRWGVRCVDGRAIGPAQAKLLDEVARIAPYGQTLLVNGESGTGKSYVARHYHASSRFSGGPFVTRICTGFAPDLLAAELFGARKGAYTGSVADRKGAFELADGGTLFLDELGDLPLEQQAAFLQVLQDSVVVRVGDDREIRVNVRVVGATNVDLAARVADGRFRDDLRYRLRVRVVMPPLRERPEEIPWLVTLAVAEINAQNGGPQLAVHPSFIDACMRYPWGSGNVREFQKVFWEAMMIATDAKTGTWVLGGDMVPAPPAAVTPPPLPAKELERARVMKERQARALQAVEENGGNNARAAQALGISEATLFRWKKG